eukprot:1149589-Pelagomonas_calceolata.AAC.4
MDVDGVYKAGCKWCEIVFNCHIGIIKAHELGVKHRAWQGAAVSADSISSVVSLLRYDKLEDQRCMFMHGRWTSCSAVARPLVGTPAPAPKFRD